jgi:uncharacterized protein YndB with AHSA1/START domain
MNRKDYRPTPAGRVAAERDGARWALVFVRELAHPLQRVWSALTDPAELRGWAPFDADRDLGTTGPAILTMAGGDGSERSHVTVRRVEPPRLLEYTWDQDLLRWELEPTEGGTRLTLRHTVEDPGWIPRVASGWHICLDVAELMLSGRAIGRIVAEEAKAHGWEELHASYAAALGTPWSDSPS